MEILRDHSKEKVIEAMIQNVLGWNSILSKNNLVCKIIEFDDMIRSITGMNHPIFNWIWRVRFSEHSAEERINKSMEYFHERKLPMSWYVTPFSTPSNILTLLTNTGLKVSEKGAPAMACNLRDFKEDQLDEALKRTMINVIKVETEEDLQRWGKVFYEGFDLPSHVGEKFLEMLQLFDQSHMTNYLATLNGEPVAISQVLYHSGVAGIYCVATLHNYRSKGIGTAVTLAPLMDAKQKGYEIAMLESSPKGVNVYKRIGFKEYCRFFRCFYHPEENNTLE